MVGRISHVAAEEPDGTMRRGHLSTLKTRQPWKWA
jgi:hypothetical protein